MSTVQNVDQDSLNAKRWLNAKSVAGFVDSFCPIFCYLCFSPGGNFKASVHIFDQHYGSEDMYRVAQVVTENFRDGKSKHLWVKETLQELQPLDYKRLESEIKEVKIQEDLALVRLKATIETFVGKAWQSELYRLVKKDQGWQIDAMEVVNEVLEPIEQEM